MSVENQLRSIQLERAANVLRQNARNRAANEAREAARVRSNVASYNEQTMMSASLREQIVAKVNAAGIGRPQTMKERVASFDVANAVATLRADKGIPTPELVETVSEAPPTLAQLLEAEPETFSDVGETPVAPAPEAAAYSLLDAARQRLTESRLDGARKPPRVKTRP